MSREDLDLIWEFNNDLEVELASGGDPPIPQSLERLQAEFDTDANKGGRDGPRFAIDADDRLIGHCALFRFDDVARTCELGLTIGDKDYWGRGYERDAIPVLLEYAFRLRNLHRVFLSVNAGNERAIRAYKGSGFIEEGRLRSHVWSRGQYEDLVYMGILRDEWSTRLGTDAFESHQHGA